MIDVKDMAKIAFYSWSKQILRHYICLSKCYWRHNFSAENNVYCQIKSHGIATLAISFKSGLTSSCCFATTSSYSLEGSAFGTALAEYFSSTFLSYCSGFINGQFWFFYNFVCYFGFLLSSWLFRKIFLLVCHFLCSVCHSLSHKS